MTTRVERLGRDESRLVERESKRTRFVLVKEGFGVRIEGKHCGPGSVIRAEHAFCAELVAAGWCEWADKEGEEAARRAEERRQRAREDAAAAKAAEPAPQMLRVRIRPIGVEGAAIMGPDGERLLMGEEHSVPADFYATELADRADLLEDPEAKRVVEMLARAGFVVKRK